MATLTPGAGAGKPVNAAASDDPFDFAGVDVKNDHDDNTDAANVSGEQFGYWVQNTLLKILALMLKGGNAATVRNETGATLTKGTLLRVTSYSAADAALLVAKADADDPAQAAVLVLDADLANNTNGRAYPHALVTGLDTSGSAAVGSAAYLSATAGEFTFTAPTGADQIKQRVGVVTVKDAAAGAIHFFPARHLVEALGTSALQALCVSTAKLAAAAVTPDKTDGLAAQALLLNPGFESTIIGTHTAALKQHTGAGVVKNTQYKAWQVKTASGGAPDLTIDEETATIGGQSLKSCRVKVDNIGSGTMSRLRQIWGGSNAEWGSIDQGPVAKFAAACRSKKLSWSADVKLGTAAASAVRLYISTDGTGGTTTYSSYHGNNTDWERLFVTVPVPSDATYVLIGFEFAVAYATCGYVYLDNGQTAITEATLTELAYRPRLPVNIIGPYREVSGAYFADNSMDTSVHVSGDGAASTDFNHNTNRPAWADSVNMGMYVSSNAGGHYVQFKPSGITTTGVLPYTPAASIPARIDSMMPLGVDGEIQFQANNANCIFNAYLLNWVGKDL